MLGEASLSDISLSDLSGPLTPGPPPVVVVPPAVVVSLQEAQGEAGGYTIPMEFVPQVPFLGHPKKLARFFGHPRPNQAYPPELKSIQVDRQRQLADDEELLTAVFG